MSQPNRFPISLPPLSRGTADRGEDLREPTRLAAQWLDALVLPVSRSGGVQVSEGADGPELALTAATGGTPPADGVLLGRITDHRAPQGRDVWAIPDMSEGGAGLRELGAVLSDTDAGLLTSAVATLGWHARSGFCQSCGSPSAPTTAGWARRCPNGHEEFPRTDPAVIVLVHDGDDRMVLARQPTWPQGRVSVLAGFVEAGESLEATVCREIEEEVGLTVTAPQYLGSQPWPFPRSLMVGFAAVADPAQPLRPRTGEISEAFWVDRDTVRRVLAAGGRPDDVLGISLPPGISIARQMIESWTAAG